MAKAGLIPKDLANIKPPVCPGCAYGKAHQKPWRYKGSKNRRTIRVATAPGQVVSVDQLVSPMEGFVPTHRGTPTTLRYQGATVFVNHFSDFTYVHLMTKLDSAGTVEAKQAFERISSTHGVVIRHYHANNGLFDSKVFKDAIQKGQQILSFCGVNTHHQNGKAEARIKDVTMGARTAFLHAAHRWLKAIDASLWPSALKHYTNIRNALPTELSLGRRSVDRHYQTDMSTPHYPNSLAPRLNPTSTTFIRSALLSTSSTTICNPITPTTSGAIVLGLESSSVTRPPATRLACH
jgi:hypothetical protein